MQKLQDSVFSIFKTTSLSSAVFSFLQPTEDCFDKTPLGGILKDTKYGWLALGPKFCVVDLRSGLKIAARTFGNGVSNRIAVTSVVELPTPLTDNSQQLIISLECDDTTGLICVFHINGSQLLRCIRTDVIITKLAVCDDIPNGPLMCFDGVVMAGTRRGEIFVFDLNKSSLLQALKDISQGYENHVKNDQNVANLIFLSLKAVHKIDNQRDLAVENEDHLAVLLNENSFLDNQYIFRNPDGTVRMKAKQNHIRTTVVQYIPQLGSLAVGFNFGAFQLWNLLNLELEFTSQVNVECLPVTDFGFQEPCDDPRAFCYLWVVFSVIDRFEEEEFPLAVMFSLTYQGKRMLTDNKCLYQEFSMATIRFQIEMGPIEDVSVYMGGRCISCHTYSINSILGEEGEDTMLNLCQLVWECWGGNDMITQHCMLLFDLDQWYKDQMPATYRLENNAFMNTARCPEISRGSCLTLDLRLDPSSVSPYSHATRLEEHFYPNSLQYNCVSLNTSEASILQTVGVQRQIVRAVSAAGPACLLAPARLHAVCRSAGLTPLYGAPGDSPEDQRRFLLSVALESRLSRFLKRCAHDWATGTHSGVGCTLPFLVDWSWSRAIELKENAKELTAPLFTSSTLPDRNVIRCLEHCVQQLSQLTGLLDGVLTKCCNLVVPDALSEMEEKYKGIGTVSLYFQVVQWFVRVGLLPEKSADRHTHTLPYPVHQLCGIYNKRRIKLHRLEDKTDDESNKKSCSLLYIDQLIEHEFGGNRVHQMWIRGGSESEGVYPPPSLFSLLRLYLLPDIPVEHKHSLLLYLLLDYSMIYDDLRHEAVIRRLMQFPTMFGLSNTAIKATQAFWHLDHRDFDFALDQLQCLTGNTLSDWQHHVVLSSLLAQKKTQSALQYLHVRKPAPIHVNDNNDYDKLEDWQTSSNLYLARGLVFEALDVIRMCVENAGSIDNKVHLLHYFYKGCRNTGQLAKVLQVTLLPFEEEVFIKYLKECKEPQTSDILVMYYLQQARYLEAEQYNVQLQAGAGGAARDALVRTLRRALPPPAAHVAHAAAHAPAHTHTVVRAKPLSVYVQASSPKNTLQYKSSFIQDTIENASETWTNRPIIKKGLKRALNIEETPFICTPKAHKTKSILQDKSDGTPAKRVKLDLNRTPRTPKSACQVSDALSQQLASFLDMPDVESPHRYERIRPETPQSILKSRRSASRGATPRSDHHSEHHSEHHDLHDLSDHSDHGEHDITDDHRHLRFTIPTSSEAGSTPSPVALPIYTDTEVKHTASHPLESPPKKFAMEYTSPPKKTYKDNVRARRSLSISANSSLSEDPNMSIESIADIPVTLINPRYTGERYSQDIDMKHTAERETDDIHIEEKEMDAHRRDKVRGSSLHKEVKETEYNEKCTDTELLDTSYVPRTPRGRRGIRNGKESTPIASRSRSQTPERCDSPIVTPMRVNRNTRSKSRTPDPSPHSLTTIQEQPKQEKTAIEKEPHTTTTHTTLVPPRLRSRSRTPERIVKIIESPRLEAIKESPNKPPEPTDSPTRRRLRSRSRTPEVECNIEQPVVTSPRSLRSRSKTPEKLMSPKKDLGARSKKSLSRIVLEANAFAKTKQIEKIEAAEEKSETSSVIECTPMKSSKNLPSLMDVTFSPIVNKSILQSSTESFSITEKVSKASEDSDQLGMNPLPAFTTINEIYSEKSVLHSYQSSMESIHEKHESIDNIKEIVKPLPAFTSINEDFGKSVLNSFESSIDSSHKDKRDFQVQFHDTDYGILSTDNSVNESKLDSLMTSDSEIEVKADWSQLESQDARVIQKEKEKIVEIEREIHEIEGEMSDECQVESSSESDDSIESEEDEEESESDNDNEVISIEDSDVSSDTDKLQIDEEDNDAEQKQEESVEQINEEYITENIPVVALMPEIKATVSDIQEQEANENSELFQASELKNLDPLNQAGNISILTDDNSIIELEHSVNLNYSDDKNIAVEKVDVAMETDQPVEITLTVEQLPIITEIKETPVSTDVDVVDAVSSTKQTNIVNLNEHIELVEIQSEKQVETVDQPMETDETEVEDIVIEQESEVIVEKVEIEKPVEFYEQKVIEKEKVDKQEEFEKEALLDKDNLEKQEEYEKEELIEKDKVDQQEEFEKEELIEKDNLEKQGELGEELIVKEKVEKQKESKENENEAEIKDVKKRLSKKNTKNVPKTIKQLQSTTSTKSKDETETAEEIVELKTPRRGRPPKSQVRTPEKNLTPKSRAKTPTSEVRVILTRRASKDLEKIDEKMDDSIELTPRQSRRGKKNDDNVSVTSDSSVKSAKSKASEEEVKAAPIRKGRKSILNVKPDLSVIPEAIAEESKDSTADIINEYSNARRLTRNQKSVLGSWLTPSAPAPRHSDHEGSSDNERDSDSETDFKPQRLARAASETKSTPKPARIGRRGSVDVGATPEAGSPLASPARGRRASFTRACEALQTPKRRLSTDIKDSPLSEAEATPRRGRRPSTSSAKQDTPGSKKASDTNKEIKE